MRKYREIYIKNHKTYKYFVYAIKYDGDIMYIGKTYDFEGRKRSHIKFQGTNRSAIPLDVELDKITFEILATTKDNYVALSIETNLIKEFGTIGNGWNKKLSLQSIK